MVDQLAEGDRISIVAFDDEAELRLKPTAMDESGRAAMRKAIDKLKSRGGTNIEAGLKLAYEQVSPSAGDADVVAERPVVVDPVEGEGSGGTDAIEQVLDVALGEGQALVLRALVVLPPERVAPAGASVIEPLAVQRDPIVRAEELRDLCGRTVGSDILGALARLQRAEDMDQEVDVLGDEEGEI